MKERRSPCLSCEFKDRNKIKCSENCKKLRDFQKYLARNESVLVSCMMTHEPPGHGRRKGPDIITGG